MDLKKFRDNIGTVVTLLPRPKADGTYIKESLNHWIIVDEDPEGAFLFKNTITNHEKRLTSDNIREFRNPAFVILAGQMTLKPGGAVEFEPFAPGLKEPQSLTELVDQPMRLPDSSETVRLRQKWKTEFEQKIYERRKAGLRTDVIIRDMKRIDDYPDCTNEEKGISPWFRVGLIGTYHKGIMLGLRWGNLTMDQTQKKWRFTNYQADERGDVKVILIGYVPYENIESVDWEGDEYYGFPHIYCYFDTARKEPYETLAFCEEKHSDDIIFYTKVADYDSVREFSKECNIESYF